MGFKIIWIDHEWQKDAIHHWQNEQRMEYFTGQRSNSCTVSDLKTYGCDHILSFLAVCGQIHMCACWSFNLDPESDT